MKKLLLLPLLSLFIVSCTADTEDFEDASKSSARVAVATPEATITDDTQCFTNLSAHVYIDLSNGFGNGLINFIADVPAGASGNYRVKVEIEELSDCEDLASGNGNVRTFSAATSVKNNTLQVTGIAPSQTFPCYRWRMVVESVIAKTVKVSCKSITPWYDAPLF